MAFLSSLYSLQSSWRACRNLQMSHLFRTQLALPKRVQTAEFWFRRLSWSAYQTPVISAALCQKSRGQRCHPYRHGMPSSPACLVLACRMSSCEDRPTGTDNRHGKKRVPRNRNRIRLEEDVWLTKDQWRRVKTDWISEQQQLKKLHIPRSLFEFELSAMGDIAAQGFANSGKSFIAYMKEETVSLNYQLISKCLFMSLSCADVDGMLWCIDWLNEYPNVMDKGTIANVISGLCLTDRWRESQHFVSKADDIGSVTARILEPLFIAACDNGDMNLAKDLIEDHYRRNLMLSEVCSLKLFSTFHSNSQSSQFAKDGEEIVTRLLRYMQEKRHFPLQSVAHELGVWFKSKCNEEWTVTHTNISHDGTCQACKGQLESLTLTESEFDQLRGEVFTKVIRGQDIFKKTTPEELEAFMTFVDNGPQYDIVLDGLNVANIKKRRSPGRTLREFVVHLVEERGYRCLVLGRHHMLKQHAQYSRRDMDTIQHLADCFFTQNMSEDDPFMLYATMHSGPEARYVTRDMLRDHKALLSPGSHRAFIKWQRTHQLIPDDIREGRPVFQKNLSHDTVIQSTERSWHIPYDDGQPRFSYEVPKTWLCAVKTKTS